MSDIFIYSISIDYSGHSYIYYVLDEYLFISTDCIPVFGSGVKKSKPGSVTGSGMDFTYLTFLDICLEANIFRYVDDGTRAVRLPSTLSIGRCTYENLYVRLSLYFCCMILVFTLI